MTTTERSLRIVSFEGGCVQTWFSSTSGQLEEASSVSWRKYWKQEEINVLKKAFQDNLANNLVSIETVRQRLTEDESLHSKLNATTLQTYNKLRSLAVSGQVSSSVGVSIWPKC